MRIEKILESSMFRTLEVFEFSTPNKSIVLVIGRFSVITTVVFERNRLSRPFEF
jgi:hypothetical protein